MPHPARPLALLLLLLALGTRQASGRAFRYKAPDECQWRDEGPGDDDGVALECRLHTINSELENTNFKVIQPQNTRRLRLECSDALFYQSSLTAVSFRPLTELRELQIDYCKIANLSDDAFRGLGELRNLTVRTHNADWSNMALELGPRAFGDDLIQLERLDLGSNNIWNLPDAALCGLYNLEYLNFTRNRLRDLTAFRFGQRCTANLRALDLSQNGIEILQPGAFSGLSRLHFLDLSGNHISAVADRAFEGLTGLATIWLANNRLGTLPPELFADAKDVQEIQLSNNSLAVLPPGLLRELKQLLVLDLSHNELSAEWINSATFAGLVRLVVLDLSANRITRLEPAVFRDLYTLQILRLQQNHIESLAENMFATLSNLHTLELSDNRLTNIDAATFSGLYVLSLLSLDNNRLSNLHPASLRNASSLQDLHLNGNAFQDVPEALKATPLLRSLDLGENLITSIPQGVFDHMTQLSGLRLIDNRINSIGRGVFDKAKDLGIVNLSGNRIQYLEPGIFDENSKLQAIRLDSNQLTDISGIFTKLPNLVWLNVSANRLRSFDYSMIPTGLQWLDIHANEVTELGNYYELEDPQLMLNTLDASQNKLSEISGGSIPAGIEMLYLNDNLISQVSSYSFFQKPNLTRVDLKGNRIRRIEPHALRISTVPEGRPLPEFYIGDNDYLCDCTMEWLQRINDGPQSRERVQPRIMDLESIYCELLYDRERLYVPLVEAQHSQFLCKYDSHCFALCHCCDFDACDCEMTCPENCTCYQDQTWTSNIVDCSVGGHVSRLPEQIPMDATRLYLDGNDLRVITSHAFIGRKRLHTLFLNASNIETLQNRSFNGLKNLEDLHLQDNGLRELAGYEFLGLESLRSLHLERNQLSAIAHETFETLRSLKHLSLRNNRLTSVAMWLVLPGQVEVSLSGNPWSCDCAYIREYREWVAGSRVNVVDAEQLRCIYNATELAPSSSGTGAVTLSGGTGASGVLGGIGEQFADGFRDSNDLGDSDDGYGFSLMTGRGYDVNSSICLELESIVSGVSGNFTKTLVHQRRQLPFGEYLPFVVATLGTFLMLGFFCVLGFFFRHEMRVWCHSRFGVRLFYRHADVDRDDRDKLFDAFISYSAKDEAFVLEELVPVLEMGSPAYKLCLHYRDFPVGSFPADTIVQAVESSRRTILVLSENFIKSEWCRFDFKSAHHQMLRDRRRRLIIVLVGDVPQRDLDPDIRLYLKNNTYLQWGDKLFWEKLRFALPDVPNNQRPAHAHLHPNQRRYQPPPVLRRQHNNPMPPRMTTTGTPTPVGPGAPVTGLHLGDRRPGSRAVHI